MLVDAPEFEEGDRFPGPLRFVVQSIVQDPRDDGGECDNPDSADPIDPEFTSVLRTRMRS